MLPARSLGTLLVALSFAGCGSPELASRQERIVLVVIDTLRADHVSPHAPRRRTPHFARLAEKGQVFERASGSYYQTTMSMASLFTGRTPSLEGTSRTAPLAWTGKNWCGLRRFAREGLDDSCIPESLPTLAGRLREAGYWTVGVVTNTLLFQPRGFERGFDEWVEVGRLAPAVAVPGYQVGLAEDRSAERANENVAWLLDQRPTDHFFLYVHYMEAHDYLAHGISYAHGVHRADAALGELLGLLEARSLLEGTTLFVVSDHGERLEEEHFTKGGPLHYGNPAFEEVLHVPFLVSPPIAGVDAQAALRGDDVHRLVLMTGGVTHPGPKDLEDGELFTSERYYQTYRKGRFKSYWRRRDGRHFLVDLEADPGETNDAATRHPEVLARHAERMADLSRDLALRTADASELSDDDAKRLEALGYVLPDAHAPE